MDERNVNVPGIMLNKVPEITLYFWVIKILATTVGETAADLLSVRLNFGLTATSAVMCAVFMAVLLWQLRLDRYVPFVYWLTVVLISVVGTLVSDNLVDGVGISLVTTSVIFAVCLVATFSVWYASERTLSIDTIVTPRREQFYWFAILFTFAMGTSVGDLLAERLDLGYAQATLLFALFLGVVAVLYYILRLNAIFCFWLAYILTRPLGASVGDWLAKPSIAGGLGFGTVATSIWFLGLILAIVLYLTVSKADSIAPEAAE